MTAPGVSNTLTTDLTTSRKRADCCRLASACEYVLRYTLGSHGELTGNTLSQPSSGNATFSHLLLFRVNFPVTTAAVKPGGVSSLTFRPTTFPVASLNLIPTCQLGTLKKTKQNKKTQAVARVDSGIQTERCYLSQALRNTLRGHKKERLMAPPQSYCCWLGYHFPSVLEPQSVAVPALVCAGDNLVRTMGEGNSLVLDPAKGNRLVCAPCKKRVYSNPELPHTYSYKLWISTKKKKPK